MEFIKYSELRIGNTILIHLYPNIIFYKTQAILNILVFGNHNVLCDFVIVDKHYKNRNAITNICIKFPLDFEPFIRNSLKGVYKVENSKFDKALKYFNGSDILDMHKLSTIIAQPKLATTIDKYIKNKYK